MGVQCVHGQVVNQMQDNFIDKAILIATVPRQQCFSFQMSAGNNFVDFIIFFCSLEGFRRYGRCVYCEKRRVFNNFIFY